MDFTLQKAKEKDMPGVMQLIQELASFEKEEDAVEITVEDLKRDGFGEHPLFTCFVAKKDQEILGIALVYNRYSTWKGKTVHLEDLVVKKELRGKGIGGALYQRVMQFAKEQKVRRVEWNVLDWNTPAVNFYKNSGATILEGWQVVQMDEQNLNTFLAKTKV
ncbi:GNAT family N-acetyltransferase [Aquimarina sp. ERC-38]|uniref:GNAT family N-acetyltransferase n=1 Tax=Aquimarina sp. ERC-38 TaxID=2949996 RepID=UPI00224853FA|nr:GNAT family N-acetyltransferase [Aquimarina sp. ERC-38]UZO81960.1 GNAT family N-acetyltransferase [Aquimarina sp. ERC-38]